MIITYLSKDINLLSKKLSEDFRQIQRKYPFGSMEHAIIVPDYNVKKILDFTISDTIGISSEVNYSTLIPFFSSIIGSDFNRIWKTSELFMNIMKYLKERGFYEGHKLVTVTRELSALLNSYYTHEYQIIRNFNDLKYTESETAGYFQQNLFSALRESAQSESRYIHLNDYLSDNFEKLDFPHTVMIFMPDISGLSSIDIIGNTLKTNCADVRFYLHSGLLTDVVFHDENDSHLEGNPFLNEFGFGIKKYLEKIYTLCDYNINIIDTDEDDGTELGRIKQGISSDEPFQDTKKTQNNIYFHKAPEVRRECEFIKDSVLNLLSENNELKLSDVGVNIADTAEYEKYVSYLEYFFRSSGIHATFIDTRRESAERVLEAVLLLMSLPESVYDIETTFRILFHDAICTVAPENRIYIERLLKKAGIFRGFDKSDMENTYLTEDLHTWKQGFFRMILGGLSDPDYPEVFSTPDGEKYLSCGGIWDSQMVFDFIDSSMFILENARKIRNSGKNTLSGWVELFSDYIKRVIRPSSEGGRKLLVDIDFEIKQISEPEIDLELDLETALELMKLSLEQFNERAGQYRGTGVTVSRLGVPLSAKYRFIAGLNESGFPGKENCSVFDLKSPSSITFFYQSAASFISALFATEKALFLSYVSMDLKTSRKLPPSVVWSSLLKHSIAAGEVFPVSEIPLRRYDSGYVSTTGIFNHNARREFITYSNAVIKSKVPEKTTLLQKNPCEMVSGSTDKVSPERFHIYQLKDFLSIPHEGWSRYILKLPVFDVLPEFRNFEPLEVDAQLKSRFTDIMFQRILKGESPDCVFEELTSTAVLEGTFPSGVFLETARTKLLESISRYIYSINVFMNSYNLPDPEIELVYLGEKSPLRSRFYSEFRENLKVENENVISGGLGLSDFGSGVIYKLRRKKSSRGYYPSDETHALVISSIISVLKKYPKKMNLRICFLYAEGSPSYELYDIFLPESPERFLNDLCNFMKNGVHDYFLPVSIWKTKEPLVSENEMTEKMNKYFKDISEKNVYGDVPWEVVLYQQALINPQGCFRDIFRKIIQIDDDSILKPVDSGIHS
ncbi:MAG: exodeoxyribonuclease V subunit gamma [Deltaproteobacteria bacterium]|nr:exodeoxyribonuclease V subunit gamma [Deltaproteobacteria bacterium]